MSVPYAKKRDRRLATGKCLRCGRAVLPRFRYCGLHIKGTGMPKSEMARRAKVDPAGGAKWKAVRAERMAF